MRHLILIGLLAGAAMACQNAAAPGESGGPLLSEASEAAQLDLRVERASLISSGNALSSAIGTQGVAAGLGDDAVDGGQAQPAALAFRFGREEWLEGPIQDVLEHPVAGIPDP